MLLSEKLGVPLKNLIISLVLLSMASVGCVSSEDSKQREHVVLIRKAPGKQLLPIAKRERVGIWGRDGYVGYRTAGYWAALDGNGPTFVNPHFQDDSSDFRCIGTIKLDIEHSKVTIQMRRVVSMPGEPERTKPHPANGTYSIEAIRDARPEEAWF